MNKALGVEMSLSKEGAIGELALVADGVWAWTQGDGSWWLNNAGLIAGDDGDILVDTCATETRARALLDEIVAVRGGLDIRLALNTHLHGDHTYGNSVLPASTIIIGHAAMRAGLAADTVIDGCPPFWDPNPDWGGVTKRLPTLTFEDKLTVHTGSREVLFLHPGYAAHTSGDSVAFVPDVGVLFTGDLMFHNVTPLVFMGSLDGALESLDWLASLDPAIVVPGHGAVLDSSEFAEVLERHRSYYSLVRDAAMSGLRDGLTPLEAARRTELGDFASLPDAERIVLNLHRVYADMADRPFEVIAAFEDAVSYNRALLPTSV